MIHIKVNYKGFEINVSREKCLGGWSMLYFTVMRINDGWYLVDSFEDSADTVASQIKSLKTLVDDYLKNPQDYEDEDEWINELNETILID